MTDPASCPPIPEVDRLCTQLNQAEVEIRRLSLNCEAFISGREAQRARADRAEAERDALRAAVDRVRAELRRPYIDEYDIRARVLRAVGALAAGVVVPTPPQGDCNP